MQLLTTLSMNARDISSVTLGVLPEFILIALANLFARGLLEIFIQDIISLKSSIPFSSKVQFSQSPLISAPHFL